VTSLPWIWIGAALALAGAAGVVIAGLAKPVGAMLHLLLD
jgi:hypothetical protein